MLRDIFRTRERTVGSARRKRRYDLPLNKGTGSGFLAMLIGLMAFLAMMALGASFALSTMQQRWSAGLDNRATVEIPAEINGRLLTAAEVSNASVRIAEMLRTYPAVEADRVTLDMVGDGLISVSIREDSTESLDIMESKVRDLAPQARLDTHQGWLRDVLRFTGALKFAAILLVVTIAVTTVTAVAGGVRARLAVYRAEVELLHLMGATDGYIARQFQRYAMILALQGGAAGTAAGALAMITTGWLSGRMDVNLLPGFSMSAGQIGILAALPLMAAAISTLTARQTVMRVLTTMP